MMVKALAGLLVLAAATAAPAHDALLEQALSRTSLPASQLKGSLRTTTTMHGGKQPESETRTVDLQASPQKALASYNELKEVIGPDAHVVEQGAGRTVYAFTTHRLPRGNTGDGRVQIDGSGSDQVFDGRAEVSMDADGQPYVSRVDLRLPRAVGSLLARVKKVDISYAFAPTAAAGPMVTTAVSADADVRALFFMHRDVHTDAVFVMAPPKP